MRKSKANDACRRFAAALMDYGEPDAVVARASLRRGLREPPGYAVETHKYVRPHLPGGLSSAEEWPFYLVASLFAIHPIRWEDDRPAENLGIAFRRLREQIGGDSVERRFLRLLGSEAEELPAQLRRAISLLKAKQIPVDWSQLLIDLRRWRTERKWTQHDWAKAFWDADPAALPEPSDWPDDGEPSDKEEVEFER